MYRLNAYARSVCTDHLLPKHLPCKLAYRTTGHLPSWQKPLEGGLALTYFILVRGQLQHQQAI